MQTFSATHRCQTAINDHLQAQNEKTNNWGPQSHHSCGREVKYELRFVWLHSSSSFPLSHELGDLFLALGKPLISSTVWVSRFTYGILFFKTLKLNPKMMKVLLVLTIHERKHPNCHPLFNFLLHLRHRGKNKNQHDHSYPQGTYDRVGAMRDENLTLTQVRVKQ